MERETQLGDNHRGPGASSIQNQILTYLNQPGNGMCYLEIDEEQSLLL